MTLEFIKQINEYVIDTILEADDEEILASVGRAGYPTRHDVQQACTSITQAIREYRVNRLSQQQSLFEAHKQNQKNVQSASKKKSISEMLSDIVSAIQNQDEVPEGIILAFREQGKEGSEGDIATIWHNLVELDLIDPNDIDR